MRFLWLILISLVAGNSTMLTAADKRAGSDWWSLQPLVEVAPPQSDSLNPIDAFVDVKLEAAGLERSAPAEPRAQLRRLYFDLIGMPPSYEAVQAFEKNPTDEAYARIVDELLASAHYGERWGRHWLDVARFGESDGFERNFARNNLWPFRDWVIRSLNQDMPYDEFARMQIAGDLINPAFEGKAAVAFLAAGLHNTVVGGSEFMRKTARQDRLEEITGAVGQSFLGLTVNCARCHDHKYDPVSQKEYYQLTSAFAGVFQGELKRHSDKESATKLEELYGRLERSRKQLGAAKADEQEQLTLASEVKRLEEEFKQLSAGQRTLYSVRAVSKPVVAHLLERGHALRPKEKVIPGGVRAVTGPPSDFGLAADAADVDRRLKLAEWITHPDNPLFTRVIVNRVWHYHFGAGLVKTPNDLGFNGGKPSHPKLLEWLALYLKEEGYRLKALHRLMVTSRAYRQSSRPNTRALMVDTDNRLLWRRSPIRLDAESLRDALLMISGKLNLKMWGPGFRDVVVRYHEGSTFYEPFDKEDPELNRRTIYRFSPRGERSALLETFDCPDPATTAPNRSVTTTPLQALSMLNNPFVLRMAEGLAERVEAEVGDDVARQIQRVYELAYGRAPDEEERGWGTTLVSEHGLAALGRVVMNSNEFVVIE